MKTPEQIAEEIVNSCMGLCNPLAGPDFIQLKQTLAEAIRAAGPRVVRGEVIEILAMEYHERTGQPADPFYQGFRAAQSMNATKSIRDAVEAAWPNSTSVLPNINKGDFLDVSTWLKSELLSRLEAL